MGYLPRLIRRPFNWGVPDMSGDIMPFRSSHFLIVFLIGQFSGENRPIRPVLELFLGHFFIQCQLVRGS